jgi:moderate conductance mechanosensitive channel
VLNWVPVSVDETVVSRWSRITDWLTDSGLKIVAIIVFAIVATQIVSFIARRQTRKLDAERRKTGAEINTTATLGAHRQALVGAVRWGINFSIVFVSTIWVLIELSLPASALVPLASVVAAGLGFGAQQIVGDVLAGMFILSERQFGVGDLVRVGPLSMVGWVEGYVEEVTLRVTKLRSLDGDLVTIANGELRQTVNASRDWARMVVIVPFDRDVDLELVTLRLDAIGEELGSDPLWSPLLIEAPSVAGLDDLSASTVQLRMVGRTLPAQQWKVARELRQRIARVLREMNIEMQDPPPSSETAPPPGADD